MDHTNVSRDRWNDHWLFLTHFRKSPRTVGAIAPSSQQLARKMLDGLELEPGTRVVELGPGTGAITGEIDRRLPDSASCLADRHRSGLQLSCRRALAAHRIGLRPRRAAGRNRRQPRFAPGRSHRFRIAVCQPSGGKRIGDCCRHRGVAPGRWHVYDLSIRSCVRVPLRSRRPSDPDERDGLDADQLAGLWQPAPGIGAPLAQAKIGRAL